MEYKADIIIIGGGVIGSAIARWLSKYKLDIILVEREEDVCSGTTKANSGIIHGGYAAPEGTLKAELNIKGNPMFDKAQEELKFDFKRIGSFVVAVKEEEIDTLEVEKKKGDKRGVKGEIITDIKRIKTMEPLITDEVKAVYYCPSAGIIWPFGLTIALAENAHDNGVKFLFESPVTEIKVHNGKDYRFEVKAGSHLVFAKYIINAAGVFADKIAEMVGLKDFYIIPRKGEYILLDKGVMHISKILFPIPTKVSKGILVCPTTHGNVFIGPNSRVQEDKEDTATTGAGLNEIIAGARKLLPSVPLRKAITNFAGIRAISSTNDFVIGTTKVEGFINVAGISSPGLSAALAIADYVVSILRDKVGLKLVEKPDYNPYRKPQVRLSDLDETKLNQLIKKNPAWGKIICRCETVTEAEIVEAIHRPLGARSLDMVKKRLRPGMGRCQGAFCTPKILKILSRELKIPVEQVTKNIKGSEMVMGRTKNLESIIWEGEV
ncbi:MAG: NAD(P)/FAD-dependent oxidoreductase [Promethearchaeota archaeon]